MKYCVTPVTHIILLLHSYQLYLPLSACSVIQNCPRLKDITDHCDALMAVKYLPDVLSLIKTLGDRFHSKFSRVDASKLRVKDFCQQYEKEISNLKQLVSNFIEAWNSIHKLLGG